MASFSLSSLLAVVTLGMFLFSRAEEEDMWVSVYSSEMCASSALLAEYIFPASDACVELPGYATTSLSAEFQCAGNSEESSWTAKVFLSSDCSGSLMSVVVGDDACDCQGANVLGNELGFTVSCTGAAPVTCSNITLHPTITPPSASPTTLLEAPQPVWGALYTSSICDSDSFITDGTVDVKSGGCLGSTSSDGSSWSMSFSCAGNTSESSWSAGVYITEDCNGLKVLTLHGEDSCSCGGTSFMGYDLGAYVSCDGKEPPCGNNGDGTNSNGSGSSNGIMEGSSGIVFILIFILAGVLCVLLIRSIYIDKMKRGTEDVAENSINVDKQPLKENEEDSGL